MRYPTLTQEQMTARQREVAAAIAKRRSDAFAGPIATLLHAPEIADRVQQLGEHLRFDLRVPERLRVLAVLVAAGKYRASDVTHFASLQATRESKLADATIAALEEGRRPTGMKDDEEIVYDFCTDLIRIGRVRSATLDRALARFGREICLEIVEVCGYAVFMTTLLNVTQSRLND